MHFRPSLRSSTKPSSRIARKHDATDERLAPASTASPRRVAPGAASIARLSLASSVRGSAPGFGAASGV
jgi:hypothetical protein